MPFGRYKKNSVKHMTIQRCLRRKALQRVASAFELISSDFAIYDGKVNAHRAVPHAHFLNDPRIRITVMLALQPRSYS